MNDSENLKNTSPRSDNVAQSQGVRLHRPEQVSRPKNRIERALSQSSKENFLPPIPHKNPVVETVVKAEPVVEKLVPKVEEPKIEKVIVPKKPINWRPLKVVFRVGIFVIVCLMALGSVVYGGYRGVKYISGINHSNEANSYSSIISEVGKIVELPPNEDPTVATVTNLEPLKGQEFFKDAMVGDKVLIFSKSKKAVLYRPSESRVIVIAPLNS